MSVEQQHVDQALDYIHRNGHVSFPELQRFAERTLGIPVHGSYAIEAVPNLVLWADMSQEFIDLVRAIQATRKVDLNPTSTLVYAIDGGFLNLPIAKRPPKNGYRKPHWAPAVLHPKTDAPGKTR